MIQTRPGELVIVRHPQTLRTCLLGHNYLIPNITTQRALSGYREETMPLTHSGESDGRLSWMVMLAQFGTPGVLYHSPYRRNIDHVQLLQELLQKKSQPSVSVRKSLMLRERDSGYIWNMTAAQVRRYYPWLLTQREQIGLLLYRPPGGESLAEITSGRIRVIWEEICQHHPGQKVWIAGSGYMMRAFQILLLNPDLSELEEMLKEPIPNCGVLRFVFGPIPDSVVCTHHGERVHDDSQPPEA